MAENSERINQLLVKLDSLMEKQASFSREVSQIKEEIESLKAEEKKQVTEEPAGQEVSQPVEVPVESQKEKFQIDFSDRQIPPVKEPVKESVKKEDKIPHVKKDLEKFIGENLINKIGIIITVIGVAIGAKYAIDHQLLSPLTRIILGYLVGLALLGFALKLKRDYENFSAVLLSGSMAIIYFITYSAYSFYDLIPQILSFVLMIIITVFTVTAAIKYNRQVIAHIGLVGAYAVPFLLSEGTGEVLILFTYTAIINIGILVTAIKKYWKPLSYSSFLITWLLYLVWFGSKYQADVHFGLASAFLSIFFVTFYLMFLAYKLLQKEKFDIFDILLLLANSFIFYGVGYTILSKHVTGEHLLGLFTLGNALVHSIVSLFIYRQKLADRNLFYFVSGLVLIFITIAIPVQLNGNWVTLLWAGEAALLFWIGRTKNVGLYEILSFGLMFLAFFSLMHDWSPVVHLLPFDDSEAGISPFFNIRFLTSLLFIASFAYINYLNNNARYSSPLVSQTELLRLVSFSISATLLIVLYYSFRLEISAYWDHIINASARNLQIAGKNLPIKFRNPDLSGFKTIWLINYSLLFFSVFSFFNVKKIKSHTWGIINLVINTIVILFFLTQGLYRLSELRETFLTQPSEYYTSGSFNIVLRYISFVFVGIMLASTYMYINKEFIRPLFINLKIAFDILLYTSVIWILSSELLSWLDIMDYTQSYKLTLSILWGVSALGLISIGIWKKKKHLRIAAILLFAVTLIKLFVYDISHLDTISKTIVFVSLGVLLLIISFLYNKYRHIIAGDSME